jgi:hypothetical protein
VGSPDAGPDVLEASPMDASNPCGAPGILHTPPNVPASIATPPGLTLAAGFRGNGNQVYACVASDTSGTQSTWNSATYYFYSGQRLTTQALRRPIMMRAR